MVVTRPHALATILAASVITGCSTQPVSAPAGRALTHSVSAKIDTAITAALRTAKAPGAMVGVWAPEGDYLKAFGKADTAAGIPMRTDFYSRAGSVTKMFTAMVKAITTVLTPDHVYDV